MKRAALAALIVTLSGVAGPTECEQLPAQAEIGAVGAPPPPAALKLVGMRTLPSASGYYAFLTVQATLGSPLQAFDVDVYFTPGVLSRVDAVPHQDFSDDAVLASAGTPDLANGVLSTVADVRHGAFAAVGGSPNLFNLLLRVNGNVPLWVQVDGELAGRSGKRFATTPSARVRLQPPPL